MNRKPDLHALDQCVKCGNCRAVCPVFRVTGDEGNSARGKLGILGYLYRDGDHFSRETMSFLHACVMCGACEHACPRDVPFLDIMADARSKGVAEGNEGVVKRLALQMLAGNKAWKSASKLASLLPSDSGLLFKLPALSRFWPKPQLNNWQDKTAFFPAKTTHKFDILYFPGCTTRHFLGETGDRLIQLLNRAGVGVYIDERFRCCGFPHYTAGETRTKVRLQDHNLVIAADYRDRVRFLVTSCATCGSHWKQTWESIPQDSLPVRDVTEVLVDELEWSARNEDCSDSKERKSIIYHDPCHLGREQGVREQPRRLLEAIAAVQDLSENDLCCGFGGSFSVFEAELSRRIGDKKANEIEHTAQQSPTTEPIVVTACPGCIIQIQDALRRNENRRPVFHIVDILYRALEESDDET